MCEANAYMIKDGEEQLLLESVDVIEPEDRTASAWSIFSGSRKSYGAGSRG